MYSRLTTCTIQRNKVDEFRNVVNNEFLPRIQAQPGFLENVESCDPSSGKYMCLTVWKSEADVRNYNEGLFQEVARRLAPLMEGPPDVQTLPVDNASAQKMRAGEMAAVA
jgi:quinol monooxygenase YgiN